MVIGGFSYLSPCPCLSMGDGGGDGNAFAIMYVNASVLCGGRLMDENRVRMADREQRGDIIDCSHIQLDRMNCPNSVAVLWGC